MSRAKGFRTVLTSNGTLLTRVQALIDSLPHKVQLSLHSHEANVTGELTEYMNQVMTFATEAAARGTCVVLRLWNQGGHTSETDDILRHMERYVPRPWRERPDGYRLTDNLYLEYDRKFRWPDASRPAVPPLSDDVALAADASSVDGTSSVAMREVHCRALQKQIGVLADGSLVPCCLDHDGAVVLGNLLRQSLDDILSSPRAKALVDGFDHHRAVEPLCQTCESASVRHSFRGKARRSLT